MNDRLDAVLARYASKWPADNVALAVVTANEQGTDATTHGTTSHSYALASVTKVFTALCAAIAVEEVAIDLDAPTTRGTSMRHLLAHAAGYPFDLPDGVSLRDAQPVTPPATKRIYSNVGIDIFAEEFARVVGFTVNEYFDQAVARPLGLQFAAITGSPARDGYASADDLARIAAELLRPTLMSPVTIEAMRTPQFPELGGLVPGIGSFRPNPWGLGVEIRGKKAPHWTGTQNSAATFGHFGAAGTFLWVDPEACVALVGLGDQPFGPWARPLWSELSDEILATARP